MDLFEKQAQLQSLFQTSPVDAAYAQGTPTGRRIAGKYQDLDVALLLLQRVNASEFFDYQVYFVSELSKTLEIEGLDVVILNQASLLQRAQIIRSWSLLYQRDQKRRVHFEARSVMEYLEFKKYDDVQSKALAERTRGERFAIDSAYVRARIARLREYTTLLADLRQIEHTKFKADPKLYGLAQWYLQQAGGATAIGNKKEAFVIRANGTVVGRASHEWWAGNAMSSVLQPGDTIYVPDKVSGGDRLKTLSQMAQMMSGLAVAAGVAFRF